MSATLAFEDESGFSLVSPLKGTWAPRGQTPVIRSQISHHKRVNAIGALLVTPGGRCLRLFSQLLRKNVDGKHVLAFLKKLLRAIKGPIVWVWDNHPIHGRKLVKAFIAQHPRLHVYHFPSYAPELNPAEGVWAQAKEYTAGSAPHHIRELHRNVYAAVKRTANSPRRLRACFRIAKLPAIK